MRPEVILLDCGGTLSWPPFDRLDQILSDLQGQAIGIEAHYRAFAHGTFALDDYMRRHHGGYPTADSLSLNHWVYEEGITRAGYPGLWTMDCTMEILRRDRRLGKWDYTFPWVRESLERIKNAGYRLGLVSNSDGMVRELLQSLDYAKYFEIIVDSAVERVWKPDPRIFYLALDRMRLSALGTRAYNAAHGEGEPAPVMYVGDNWRSDFEGARNAGLDIRLIDPLGLYSGWTDLRTRDMETLAEEVGSMQ